jgi:hypothetical protein
MAEETIQQPDDQIEGHIAVLPEQPEPVTDVLSADDAAKAFVAMDALEQPGTEHVDQAAEKLFKEIDTKPTTPVTAENPVVTDEHGHIDVNYARNVVNEAHDEIAPASQHAEGVNTEAKSVNQILKENGRQLVDTDNRTPEQVVADNPDAVTPVISETTDRVEINGKAIEALSNAIDRQNGTSGTYDKQFQQPQTKEEPIPLESATYDGAMPEALSTPELSKLPRPEKQPPKPIVKHEDISTAGDGQLEAVRPTAAMMPPIQQNPVSRAFNAFRARFSGKPTEAKAHA